MSDPSPIDAARWLALASDPIHVRDVRGRVTFANPVASSRFGWPECSVDTPHDPGDRRDIATSMEACETVGFWRGDLVRSDAHGNRLVLESHWNPVRAGDGRIEGYFVLETDMTEVRATQGEALRAQRMESIGTLAGGVAHQINNVLGPILIGAEMIRRRVDDPWVQKKLASIEEAARAGADIVKQVLDFARGVEGEMIVLQVRHVLKEVASFAERTFSRSITIETDLPTTLPPVVGDAALLRQVLLNLLVNARDAMPDGGRLRIAASEVTVSPDAARSLGTDARSGRFVRLDVQDSGTGIPPEVMARMFEPFFSTKTRGQGTGLGLSTVITIVRGHGGFLHIDSEVGRGTTMSIYLPVHAAENEPAAPTPDTGGASESLGRGMTVLIVDDEPLMLEMNCDMLESFGFKVFGAANGQEGLDAFLARPAFFDIVVTDINMPVMDGATMIRRMRAVREDLPVIAVSGLTEHVHLLEGKGLDGVEILAKPYSSAELLDVVCNLLPRAAPGSSSAPLSSGDVLSDTGFDALFKGDDW